MEKPQPLRRFLLEIGVLVVFVFLAYAAFEFLISRASPAAPVEAPAVLPSSSDEGGNPVQVEASNTPYPGPYPPPGPLEGPPQSPPLPEIVQDLYSKSNLFSGYKAAAFVNDQVWLIHSDRPPEVLVDFGEVAAIFGWSYNGSKLLFGRGLYASGDGLGDATELWLYDAGSREARRLVDMARVWSASWSPVDDRVAYCEYGDVLTIVDVEGNVFGQIGDVLCDFTWSPDGSSIAIAYSSPDMVLSDGARTSAIALWWLERNELQLLSDAKFNADRYPIWTIDGQRILFKRSYTELSDEEGMSGLYISSIPNGKTVYLSEGPSLYPAHLSRSPRSDALAFSLGNEIYIMEFDGSPRLIGYGYFPVWLPDGKTLAYQSEDGEVNLEVLDVILNDHIAGGGQNALGISTDIDLFFTSEAIP